jgi:hypothetical protein
MSDHNSQNSQNRSVVARKCSALTTQHSALLVGAIYIVLSGGAFGQRSQSAPPPRISTEFQPVVAQLSASGLKVKEAREASLDGSTLHLAAIFQRETPKEASESFEFRILENNAGTSKTIFRRTEFFFSFPSATEMANFNLTDINGDGAKEVIIQSSSGGNCWSCNPTEIYRVRNHAAQLIAAAPIQRIADLNGDGVAELLVTDARWEVYDDLSHAAAPSATMVFAWKAGQYVYASRDFPAYYATEIERLRQALVEAKSEITADDFSDEAYVGRAVALAITFAHMGEVDRGLKELEALMNSNVRSQAQSKRRTTVVTDFRSGDSSKQLRQMKYGDPLPL